MVCFHLQSHQSGVTLHNSVREYHNAAIQAVQLAMTALHQGDQESHRQPAPSGCCSTIKRSSEGGHSDFAYI